MVTKQQKETGAAVCLDRKSLMGCIESFMPQEEEYVVEVPLVDYAGGLGPFLFRLPREVRDQIFSDLVASGSPQFMSVSRAMNVEGMALIYTKGVYRMNFGYDVHERGLEVSDRRYPHLTQEIAKNIQNLCMRVSTKAFPSPLEANIFADVTRHVDIFAGHHVARGTCIISFELYLFMSLATLWDMVSTLQGLGGFDTVLLRVDIDSSPSPIFSDHLSEVWFRDEVFRMAQEQLKSYLGEGEKGSDKDGSLLVFRPRKRGEQIAASVNLDLDGSGD